MASSDWQEIYRSYSAEELTEEIAKLKADLDGGFAAQGSGSTNHQRDTTQLQNRLHAAIRVRSERAGSRPPQVGRVDFSGNTTSDF